MPQLCPLCGPPMPPVRTQPREGSNAKAKASVETHLKKTKKLGRCWRNRWRAPGALVVLGCLLRWGHQHVPLATSACPQTEEVSVLAMSPCMEPSCTHSPTGLSPASLWPVAGRTVEARGWHEGKALISFFLECFLIHFFFFFFFFQESLFTRPSHSVMRAAQLLAAQLAHLLLHRVGQPRIEGPQGGLDPGHLIVGQLEPVAKQAGEEVEAGFARG